MTDTRPSTSRWSVATTAVLLVVLAACQAQGSGSASPSVPETPIPSAGSPAATGNSPPAFPAVELPPGSLVRLHQELELSDLPGEPTVTTLEDATEVVVVSGPRELDGETWYEVRFPPDANAYRFAWTRLDGPDAVELIEGTCPAPSQEVLGMLPWDRVICFGNSPVTLVGQVGHCQGGVVLAEPEWLADDCWGVGDETGDLALHATPESGILFPDDLVRARMTGHFDDPAASTCRPRLEGVTEAWRAPSPTEQILLCREAFVVDTFEILEVLGPGTAG